MINMELVQIQRTIEKAIEEIGEMAWDYPMEFDTKKGVVVYDGPGDIGTKKGDKISEQQAVDYALWFSLIVEAMKKHSGKALRLIKKSKVNEAMAQVELVVKQEALLGESETWAPILLELKKFSD